MSPSPGDHALFAFADEDAATRAFRAEVRAFVAAHLPPEIAAKTRLGLHLTKEDYVGWQRILRRHGWFAAAWPTAYGGAGWDLERQLTFAQQAAISGAPMIIPYGVNMVGPVIARFGNAAQQARYLPGILDSTTWWCQGYSEPNAGSDLASLKTFAERDGDCYVVNGSKMWTTQAQWADMMHCLVRTSREGKPQQGISFLLIDMTTPGITVRPIITSDGQHHVNQTFLDNVRVPVENRIGTEGQGWTIAKFLLGNERIAIADTGPKLHLLAQIKRMAALLPDDGAPGGVCQSIAARIAALEIELAVLCAMERRYVRAWSAGGSRDGPEASVLKIRGTEILQALADLAMEIEGPWGAVHDPADLHRPADATYGRAQQASAVADQYLYSRAWSLFGGTNEVQRNIIARALGIG